MEKAQILILEYRTNKLLKSLNLSLEEKIESLAIARELTEDGTFGLFSEASYTTNAGAQYLMLENPSLMYRVVDNRSLHKSVVSLFLDNLEARKQEDGGYLSLLRIIDSLMTRPVVVADIKLFKRTWFLLEAVGHSKSLYGLEGAYNSILYNALDFNSNPRKPESSEMSIETFMFIMGYLNDKDETTTYSSLLNISRRIAEYRKIEIDAWIQEKMPDYVGLPLSWVLKTVDLYI